MSNMQIRREGLLWMVVLLVAVLPAHGQTFDSGSICGTDPGDPECLGDVVISTTTVIQLPDDGILQYGSFTLDGGGSLSFTPNALNTPVYILASGSIQINGILSLNGKNGGTGIYGEGGPGGFAGGVAGVLGEPGGAGLGPGAGTGGSSISEGGDAAYRTLPAVSRPTNGATYGSALLVPLTGGSGGGGVTGYGGGGGGGAILLASNESITINGVITAYGGAAAGTGSDGSGGAIRLVAPSVSGAGSLQVLGGGSSSSNRAGAGRTRIDAIDRSFGSIAGVDSVGAYMRAFLDPRPSLDILQVGDEVIPVGTLPPPILLPFEAPATQTVVVQATDFPGVTEGCTGPIPCLPLRLSLIPDTGPVVNVDAEIDLSAGSPAQASIDIDFPANVTVRVQAWTR
jgi:hypothetical protein